MDKLFLGNYSPWNFILIYQTEFHGNSKPFSWKYMEHLYKFHEKKIHGEKTLSNSMEFLCKTLLIEFHVPNPDRIP